MNTARAIYVLIVFSTAGLIFLSCSGYSTTQLLNAEFVTVNKDLSPIDLLAPSDKSVSTKNPKLVWSRRAGAISYSVEMSAQSDFSSLLLKKSTTETSYSLNNGDLISITTLDSFSYYWRVKAIYADQQVTSESFLFHVLDDTIVYVSSASTASDQVGNRSAPFKKIQSGIEAADTKRNGVATTPMFVYVAGGSYTEEVNLKPGISIYGGYSSTDWSRNTTSNVTALTGPTEIGLRSSGTVTTAFRSTTVVDGLDISGGSGSTNSIAVQLDPGASPTITNNILRGKAGNVYSYGVRTSDACPCSPIISNNTILGGNAPNTNYGIYIWSATSPISINNNIISGGTAGTSQGLSLKNSTAVTISNNVIMGGSGTTNYAIYLSTSSPTVFNNTINGGTTGSVFAIYMTDTSNSANLRNNILFNSTGTGSCIHEAIGGMTPSAVQANNFFGCPTFYQDNVTGAVTNLTTSVITGAGTNTLAFFGNTNIDNATPTAGQLFVDIDGADNNLATIADNDWHLADPGAATTCNILFGGQNLSGTLTTDRDAILRTATLPSVAPCSGNVTNGGTGWSMGAYEN